MKSSTLLSSVALVVTLSVAGDSAEPVSDAPSPPPIVFRFTLPEMEVDEVAPRLFYLERRFADVAGVASVWSVMRDCEVVVIITLKSDADAAAARDSLVAHALQVVHRLHVQRRQEPDLETVPSSDPRNRVVVTLESPDMSSAELGEWAEREIASDLRTVPGVALAETRGAGRSELSVRPDIARLKAFGLGLQDIERAVGALANSAGRAVSLDDLQRTVVSEQAGLAVRLADLAAVERTRAGAAPRSQWRGAPDGAEATVASAAAVIEVRGLASKAAADLPRAVNERLERLRERLPAGARLAARTLTAEDLQVELQVPSGVPDEQVSQLCDRVASMIADQDGVANVWRIDGNGSPYSTRSDTAARLLVALTEKGMARSTESGRAIDELLRDVPGIRGAVRGAWCAGSMPGIPNEHVVAFVGADEESTRTAALQVQQRLDQHESLASVEVFPSPAAMLKCEIDKEQARQAGLEPDAIRTTIARIVHGWPMLLQPLEDGHPQSIVLRVDPHLDSLVTLPLRSKEGAIVPLGQVARLKQVLQPAARWRVDGLPATLLGCDRRPSASPPVAAAALADAIRASSPPPGVVIHRWGAGEP